MAVSVTMPRLGESVSEGIVTRWLKKEGERVEADEPLLEVSTNKVDTEIPSPAAGIVTSIKVQEDETVEVGVELATIDDGSGGGTDAVAPAATPELAPTPELAANPEPRREPAPEAAPAPAADLERAEAGAASHPTAPPPVAPPTPLPGPVPVAESGGESTYLTPLVRKLAAEHRVDLARLQGTGVGGRIRKQDVLDAAQRSGGAAEQAPAPAAAPQPAAPAPVAAAPSAPPAQFEQPAAQISAPAPSYAAQAAAAPATSVRGRTENLSRLRKVIAARMTKPLQTSAQLTTVVDADVTRIARLRAQAKASFEARKGVKLPTAPSAPAPTR